MMQNKIDLYIQNYPEEVQTLLLKVREIALGVDPNLEQSISYGIPTLKKHGKVISHFAAQKAHLGIYQLNRASLAHFTHNLKKFLLHQVSEAKLVFYSIQS